MRTSFGPKTTLIRPMEVLHFRRQLCKSTIFTGCYRYGVIIKRPLETLCLINVIFTRMIHTRDRAGGGGIFENFSSWMFLPDVQNFIFIRATILSPII